MQLFLRAQNTHTLEVTGEETVGQIKVTQHLNLPKRRLRRRNLETMTWFSFRLMSKLWRESWWRIRCWCSLAVLWRMMPPSCRVASQNSAPWRWPAGCWEVRRKMKPSFSHSVWLCAQFSDKQESSIIKDHLLSSEQVKCTALWLVLEKWEDRLLRWELFKPNIIQPGVLYRFVADVVRRLMLSFLTLSSCVVQVDKQEKKKKKTGRAKRRIQYNRRFVNVVPTFGKKKGPNANS